ncbi:MAG: hypothetical protein P1V97_16790 [Planctomycetota bacterium]|nr:hypothetical protein [Planctomycetota bacterium]
MKFKAIAFLPSLLVASSLFVGCGNSETKDDNKNKKTVSKKDGPKKAAADNADDTGPPDLTGKWTRSDGAVFTCIDQKQDLVLTRVMGEKEANLASFVVELDRKGETLEGKARFQYKERYPDDPDEFVLGWSLKATGDYEYKATVQSYDDDTKKAVDKGETFVFKIKPKFPPKPKVVAKKEPKKEPAKARGKGLVLKDDAVEESDVKSLLRRLASKSKAAESSVKLLTISTKADAMLSDAVFNVEDPIARARLSLILACRRNSLGLDSLMELKTNNALPLKTAKIIDRIFEMALCPLFNIEGADVSEAGLSKVVADPENSAEAANFEKLGKAANTELTAVGWLSDENVVNRKIAQAMVFPNGAAFGGRFGEYNGAYFGAEESKANREAVLVEFMKWYEAGPKAKLEK